MRRLGKGHLRGSMPFTELFTHSIIRCLHARCSLQGPAALPLCPGMTLPSKGADQPVFLIPTLSSSFLGLCFPVDVQRQQDRRLR